MLGQRKDKKLYAIYYASKTLDGVQINYATTEKEFLAVVFTMDDLTSLGQKSLYSQIML